MENYIFTIQPQNAWSLWAIPKNDCEGYCDTYSFSETVKILAAHPKTRSVRQLSRYM